VAIVAPRSRFSASVSLHNRGNRATPPDVPTAKEVEDQKKYSWSRPRPWDFEPSGVLALKTEESTMAAIRKSRADGKRHRGRELAD
jgi:hypothetical protein